MQKLEAIQVRIEKQHKTVAFNVCFLFIVPYAHRASSTMLFTMFLSLRAVLISQLMWTLELSEEQYLLKVRVSHKQSMLYIIIDLCSGAGCFGPMPQNEFLHRMGIRQRIEVSTD